MKYAIIKVINGNYFVHAEGITNLENAKAQYHGLCQTLWNASDVITHPGERYRRRSGRYSHGGYRSIQCRDT